MGLSDAVGLVGVLLFLTAYAGASLGKLDPTKVPALTMNAVGAVLVLYSLAYDFNLSAVVMESAWGLVALVGLLRVALGRKKAP